MTCFITLLLSSTLLLAQQIMTQGTPKCMVPPPSSNFTLKGYYGLWYEIGKFQTPGGGFFEKDCVCTTIDVGPKSGSTSVGDSTALNSCRKNEPTGKYLNATGNLIDMIKPGQWKEKFFIFAPAVNYTVVYMDDDFAVEYDCGETFGIVNYCIHIMARTPTADSSMVKRLADWATKDLGLNTASLPYQATKQVNYTVIYLDDDYAVEYDCGETFGKTNYCIYIMARTPTADNKMLTHLLVWSAITLGLNTEEMPFEFTNQTKCW